MCWPFIGLSMVTGDRLSSTHELAFANPGSSVNFVDVQSARTLSTYMLITKASFIVNINYGREKRCQTLNCE